MPKPLNKLLNNAKTCTLGSFSSSASVTKTTDISINLC